VCADLVRPRLAKHVRTTQTVHVRTRLYPRVIDWSDETTALGGAMTALVERVDLPETATADYGGPRSFTRVLKPGALVGGYRVEKLLSEGAMGRVYAAVQPEIGKRVAIKVLNAEQATADVVARFVDEARAVNRIGHPNVVDIFSLGRLADGSIFLAMELLAGESLADRITRGPMPLAEARAILDQLALALEAVHEHGIVHRDLKPANVFLAERFGEHAHVKLLDFGVAKLGDDERERSEVGLVVGTPRYLSPEQARGLAVDHRADIYALGGIAFELLTGRTAFVGESTIDVLAQQIAATPPRPSKIAPDIPEELDELVFAMLAKRPSDRPPLAALRAVLDGLDDRALSSTAELPVVRDGRARRDTARVIHRGRPVAVMAFAALTFAASAGVLAYVQLRPAPASAIASQAAPPPAPAPIVLTIPQPIITPAPAPAPASASASKPSIAVRSPTVRHARVVQPGPARAPTITIEPLDDPPPAPPPPSAPPPAPPPTNDGEPEPAWAQH
jgi:serine/threonine-protein kinase